MNHIPRLSEAVYVGLFRKIGSPTEVRFRREVIDTEEVFLKPVNIMMGYQQMMSGSRGEGFRLKTSDVDMMWWPPDHKIICDLSQINLYRIPQHTVILMESDDLPPGFTRLNLMSPSKNSNIRSSCVLMNNGVYISSSLFRDNHMRMLQSSPVITGSPFPHGPCSTIVVVQDAEVDYAFCLQSQHWPTKALPWIQRCCQQGWPSNIVVSDIVSAGFHVVPIGNAPENREAWRISFSQAEQKLVYSMNHCQFLCYGLLKIFLKEVINSQNYTPVLCSYFTKTTIFWLLQTNNSLRWTPDNLLSCFWESFKLLIYWVYIGECPNFFIPQNNMFRLKVTGPVQSSLFNQLYDLYSMGISCLLLSPTLRPYLSNAILNRTLRVCTDESSIISRTELDFSFFVELRPLTQNILSIEIFAVLMQGIERMIRGMLSPYQAVTVQCLTSVVLRRTASLIEKIIYPNTNRNKLYYNASKVSKLLKLSCRFGVVSDILYLAMYFYRTSRFEQSLICLHEAQRRMSLPYIVYIGRGNVDMYRHCMVGVSLGKKIRRAKVADIELVGYNTYIDELALEQRVDKDILFIPPVVMLHMLLILNYHRLGDRVNSQQSLQTLKTLLFYDDGFYVPTPNRDISWQILGICQQICGDFLGSLQSYQYSLQQYPFHNIQEATIFRMNTIAQGAM